MAKNHHVLFVFVVITLVMFLNVPDADAAITCASLGLTGEEAADRKANVEFEYSQNPSAELDAQRKELDACQNQIESIVVDAIRSLGTFHDAESEGDVCEGNIMLTKEIAQYNADLANKKLDKIKSLEDEGVALSTLNFYEETSNHWLRDANECLAYFEKRSTNEDLAREIGSKIGINEETGKNLLGGEENAKKLYDQNCLIATASYGSPLAPEVQMLRDIRDNKLMATSSGSTFMTAFNALYYSFSPTIADMERANPTFKEMVKLTITPLITSLTILQYVDMNSEQKVLVYGIGIILLNAGMYFVAPAIIIMKLTKIKNTKRN